MKESNVIKQFLQYIIVGAIATFVEWFCFHLLLKYSLFDYLFATAIAFVFSTFANWLSGKLIMFKNWDNIFGELVKIYLTSIAGLIFNLILMWLLVERIHVMKMTSKMIATGVVFVWNFLIRKYIIYKV